LAGVLPRGLCRRSLLKTSMLARERYFNRLIAARKGVDERIEPLQARLRVA